MFLCYPDEKSGAGALVKELANDKTLKPSIETAKEHGVKPVVCQFARKRLDVKKSDYDAYIQTTPNVYRYMFGLQEIGFKVLSL